MIVPARTDDERWFLVSYIARKLRMDNPRDLVGDMPFYVVGVVVRDELKGAVIYTNYRDGCCEMSCAGEPGWLNRADLATLFGHPFHTLECRRVTGIVHRKNKKARSLNERLGFRLEGVCRRGFKTGDAVIYGMLREDCRWIGERQ